MRLRLFKAVALFFLTTSLGVLACDLSTFGLAPAAKPQVVIQTPTSGSQFREGDDVSIQSTATDPAGIARVELAVDGATIQTDVPPIPKGQTAFTLVQRWKATPGTHTLSVRAYNASGAASDPVLISVIVSPGAAQPTVALPTQFVLPPIGAVSPTLPSISASPTAPGPTATRQPTRPPASPTVSAPPGVYATAIRVDPTAPKRGQLVGFFVTFFNNTNEPKRYRWRILIFEPEKKNAFGDTAPVDNDIPVGTVELPAVANWAVRGPGDCMSLIARVFWLDESKQAIEFLKPDRSGGPATGFQVCP